ncbi:MAG: SDR family oxidoreductase [candidate division Zixibacteria bacterium]|nr:SDR family oxidoreductase [candidate division Zixibacteria bacterium]
MNLNDSKILITGAGGLLGFRLGETFSGKCDLTLHYHSTPDKKSSEKQQIGDLSNIDYVKELSQSIRPDVIINSAALADVDRCEFEPEESRKINVKAVKLLLKYFPDAKFVHVSTDYAFDTDHVGKPDDERSPVNTYGQHKVEGEKLVQAASENNLIIRVNTLFDYTDKRNFFKYVFDSLRASKKISGVKDQTSNPISAITTAELIFELTKADATGCFHIGGAEFVSRYEFAVRVADYFKLDKSFIVPVEADSFEHRARRPQMAGLDCEKTEELLGRKMPALEEEFRLVSRVI